MSDGVVLEAESDDSLDVEEKIHVSSKQAVQCFNQVIEWAEKQGIAYWDVLVLKRLQKALSLNKNEMV